MPIYVFVVDNINDLKYQTTKIYKSCDKNNYPIVYINSMNDFYINISEYEKNDIVIFTNNYNISFENEKTITSTLSFTNKRKIISNNNIKNIHNIFTNYNTTMIGTILDYKTGKFYHDKNEEFIGGKDKIIHSSLTSDVLSLSTGKNQLDLSKFETDKKINDFIMNMFIGISIFIPLIPDKRLVPLAFFSVFIMYILFVFVWSTKDITIPNNNLISINFPDMLTDILDKFGLQKLDNLKTIQNFLTF